MNNFLTTIFLSILFLGCTSTKDEFLKQENQKISNENQTLKQRCIQLESSLELKEKELLQKLMKINWEEVFDNMEKLDIKILEEKVSDMRKNRDGHETALERMIESKFKSYVSPGPKVKNVDLFFKRHHLEEQYMLEVYRAKLLVIKSKLLKQP